VLIRVVEEVDDVDKGFEASWGAVELVSFCKEVKDLILGNVGIADALAVSSHLTNQVVSEDFHTSCIQLRRCVIKQFALVVKSNTQFSDDQLILRDHDVDLV
jgi:hypothetical protein